MAQDPDRDELAALRRMAELEAKASGGTPGGAAIVNPNLRRQGDKALRGLNPSETMLADIGGATAISAGAAAIAPELLNAAAAGVGAFPATAPLRAPLNFMSNAIRAAGRPAAAASGAIGGAMGETAGQVMDAAGAGPTAAEISRFVAGGVGPDVAKAGLWLVKNKGGLPAITNYLRELTGKEVKLSEAQTKFLNDQMAELRGGGKTDQPLEAVGSIMGRQGQDLLDTADQQMIAALREGSQVGKPGAFGGKENADIGGRLRDTITSRNQAAIDARSRQFKDTEAIRDLNVANRENAGSTIDKSPEYTDLLNLIRGELVGGQRAPSVQAGYQKILSEIENKNEVGAVSFKSIDDVRRKLGDAFRGKPAEGYDAIGESAAKDLYSKISNLQKKYAGPAQEKLLDDYHSATEGMQVFSSKMGKKATALDQFRPEQYATDPSTLPSTYFKTRASVQALKELTGSNKEVAVAALEHADKELAGKTGPQVRDWMTKNAEWLAEVRPVQGLVNKYATRLEASERSMKNAQDFAKQVSGPTGDAALLTRQSLPAQRAVDLIKLGDTKLWELVTPAIMQSPQAKTQMMGAVRQVLGDQATSKGTVDLFSRNIRPFLEQSRIATTAELDGIAATLNKIQEMKVPEPEKLGIYKRVLLNSINAMGASATARATVGTYNELATQQVPR